MLFEKQLLLLFFINLLIYFAIFKYRYKIAHKFKLFDIPDKKRKIHKFKIPKTASLHAAFFIFLLLIINISYSFYDHDFNLILIGTLSIFSVGILDDRFDLSPYTKMLLIFLITSIILFFSNDLVLNRVYSHTYDTFIFFDNFVLLNYLITILSVLLLINALNLSDGINGLAHILIITWLFYLVIIFKHDIESILFIILLTLGISLIHNLKNFHFLGDSGTLLYSSFISFITLKLYNTNVNNPSYFNSAEFIFLILMIPGIDMLRLFILRILKNKSPFKADNNHLHHLLLYKFGLANTLIYYFALVNLPIIFSLIYKTNLAITLIISLAFYLVTIYFLNYAKYNKK